MKRYDLTAIDLSEGDDQDPPAAPRSRDVAHAAAALAARRLAAGPARGRRRPRPDAASPAAAAGRPAIVIESPMVGTLYASSSPDAPPFVTVGSTVRPDTTVCIIEAMKVFTEIPAGSPGRSPSPGQERPVGRVRPAAVPRQPA